MTNAATATVVAPHLTTDALKNFLASCESYAVLWAGEHVQVVFTASSREYDPQLGQSVTYPAKVTLCTLGNPNPCVGGALPLATLHGKRGLVSQGRIGTAKLRAAVDQAAKIDAVLAAKLPKVTALRDLVDANERALHEEQTTVRNLGAQVLDAVAAGSNDAALEAAYRFAREGVADRQAMLDRQTRDLGEALDALSAELPGVNVARI